MTTPEPWYKDGLRFECTKCGDCCKSWEGSIWLVGDDLSVLAKHLNMPEQEFAIKYTNNNFEDLQIQRKSNGECPFLANGTTCSIYEAQPNQCRSYPFMRLIENSQENWNNITKKCPGANQGTLIDADEITARIKKSIKF